MKIIEIEAVKKKLEDFVYVSLTKEKVEAGDVVTVEFWCKGKLISRTQYTVREKFVKNKPYKYLWIRLPYFNVIRHKTGSGWKPYFVLKVRVILPEDS